MEINKDDFYAYLKSIIGIDIKDGTRFFEDLGITGLDAEQTMVQVSEKYNVNMDGYEPDEYHYSEGEFGNVLLHLWRAIRGRTRKHAIFTAQHLYNVVVAGKWFEPTVQEVK